MRESLFPWRGGLPSDPGGDAGRASPLAARRLSAEVLQLRFRGARGGVISQHRALARLPTTWLGAGVGIVAGGALSSAVALALAPIGVLWTGLFRFWHPLLGLPGGVETRVHGWEPFLTFTLPSVTAPAPEPGAAALRAVGIATLLLFLASLPVARRVLPLAYLMRAVALVQATAVLYFALLDRPLPYALPDYTRTMLLAGLAVAVLAPLFLGLTYNVYDVGVGRKLLVAVVVEAHLLLLVPHQYLLHAAIAHHGTAVFLPPLYLLFGLLLDVVVLVGWYAWAMARSTAPRAGVGATRREPAGREP